ncbi:MAG: LuxR C-terminal-related transcriptional regulator [Eubacteriaceae bacterium]
MNLLKNRYYILISFSIVFGWIMSFPYEGPVMYALAGDKGVNGVDLNTLTVFLHFAGLFCGRYITKNISSAKRNMLICTGGSIVLSSFIPFISMKGWMIIIPLVSFLTGITITSNGQMIKKYIPSKDRNKFVADILIYGNIVLIGAHIFANNTSPIISFVFIEIILVIAFIVTFRIDINEETLKSPSKRFQGKSILKTYWIFFLFIFLITINSGIMFQVIYPYFGQFELLTSIYTNIPYIIAIYILSRLIKMNKFYFLYVGLALWGITFILFSILGQTALSFIIICTVMLFACGIFDFFWWSIMADNFDYVKNPSSLFGLGLSINVLGVWVGGFVGNYLVSIGIDKQGLSSVGLLIVFISMLIILPLNSRLVQTFDQNEFLVKIKYVNTKEIESYIRDVESLLTRREWDVFNLLILGKTDSYISKELYISTHTVKTHNRNIYKKLNVSNRVQLISKITDRQLGAS